MPRECYGICQQYNLLPRRRQANLSTVAPPGLSAYAYWAGRGLSSRQDLFDPGQLLRRERQVVQRPHRVFDLAHLAGADEGRGYAEMLDTIAVARTPRGIVGSDPARCRPGPVWSRW